MKNKRLIAGLAAVLMAASSAVSLTGCSLFHKHTYEWETTKAPTCVEAGEEQNICKGKDGCGDVSETRKVEALGHTEGEWSVSVEPVCETDGEEVRLCTVCGEVLETRVIDALEHVEGEWTITTEPTCTEKGEKTCYCTLCETVLKTEEIEATGHEFPAEWTVVKEATCAEEGIREKHCLNCAETQTEKISKVSHQFSDWTVVKAATCENAGTEKRTCKGCGKTQERPLEKLTHTFGEWKVTKAATCAADGVQQRVCSKCGTAETKSIAKTAHTFGSWKETQKATATAEGVMTRTCSVCGKAETKSIPKLDYVQGNVGDIITVNCVCGDAMYSWEGEKVVPLKFKVVGEDKYGIQTLEMLDTPGHDYWCLSFVCKNTRFKTYYYYKGMLCPVEETINNLCEHNAMLLEFSTYSEGYMDDSKDYAYVDVTCPACGMQKRFVHGEPLPATQKVTKPEGIQGTELVVSFFDLAKELDEVSYWETWTRIDISTEDSERRVGYDIYCEHEETRYFEGELKTR